MPVLNAGIRSRHCSMLLPEIMSCSLDNVNDGIPSTCIPSAIVSGHWLPGGFGHDLNMKFTKIYIQTFIRTASYLNQDMLNIAHLTLMLLMANLTKIMQKT